MPTTAKTAAQTWIRAELVGVPDSAFGPQLMIPADGVEFHGPDLVFHREGEVVYVTRPDQLRSLTWLGPAVDPERERRRAQWPNHGKRWTDEQRESLRTDILSGTAWAEIAKSHGRSRTGVQQEAVKQGWVEAETMRPVAALLEDGTDTAGTMDTAASSHRVRVRTRRRNGHVDADADVADGGGSPGVAAIADQDRAVVHSDNAVPLQDSTASSPPLADGPSIPPQASSSPVPVLGTYVTTALAPRTAVPEAPSGIAATDPLAFRDPSSRPPFPDNARLPGLTASPPVADPLSPSSLATGLRDGLRDSLRDGFAGPGRPPGQGSGRGAPPRVPDPVPPAIPHPREPDHLPPDPVREPARLMPARPSGT